MLVKTKKNPSSSPRVYLFVMLLNTLWCDVADMNLYQYVLKYELYNSYAQWLHKNDLTRIFYTPNPTSQQVEVSYL